MTDNQRVTLHVYVFYTSLATNNSHIYSYDNVT